MPAIRVLFVCTGNQCRSPVAAALMARRLSSMAVDGEATSAGLLRGGVAPPPEVVAAAREAGLDLSGHRSRRLAEADVAQADLVVGMAREHVREAVMLDPAAFPKTFSLREVVRRAGLVGSRRPADELGEWLAELHRGRRASDLLGASPDDDVLDPMGGPATGYRAMVAEVDGLVSRLATAGWAAT
ncbi:MAG TPA: hypothetical protein VHB02_00665 [Acidimicrobiales bacterium]|nr:hypothetical protein [Acidimicrobiales bacterium]